MRYFVIGDDGQKYGPADVPTLQSWIGEGRLLPTQQVEEDPSGIRSAARMVPGLVFPIENLPPTSAPQNSPYANPGPMNQGYTRPMQAQPAGDDGQQDVTLAYVFGVLGLFCCFLEPLALFFAYRAVKKGHPGANTARIVVWVLFALWLAFAIFRIAMVVSAFNRGTLQTNPGFQMK